LAQNFTYFLIAAIINSIVRIVQTSWSCLLIEDTRPTRRVHVYTWIRVAGTLAGFFAPLAGILVGTLGLVPAVRRLYLFAFVMMTSMFLIRNRITKETEIGLRKMQESRSLDLRRILAEYRIALSLLIRSPKLLLAFAMVLFSNMQLVIRQTFLSILLHNGLEVPMELIAAVPAVYSIVMMAVFVFWMPSLGRVDPARSLLTGLSFWLIGVLMLVLSPPGRFGLVLIATVFDAVGAGIVFPVSESMLANTVADEHRAKITSILNSVSFAFLAPFGYLGGVLSSVSPKLPFVLVLATVLIRAGLLKSLKKASRSATRRS
jgi:MFS transporter, DHA1 family, tetracycline resistance protein